MQFVIENGVLIKVNDRRITAAEIPASVTEIAKGAFWDCKKLERVIFEENSQLKKIGSGAFWKCKKLWEINIPASVTEIANSAFWHCKKLKRVMLEENSQLQKIGGGAFAHCKKLQEINIPTSVKVAYSAFLKCKSLNEDCREAIEKMCTASFVQENPDD